MTVNALQETEGLGSQSDTVEAQEEQPRGQSGNAAA